MRKRARAVAPTFLAIALVWPLPARAGWASLGAMSPPKQEGNSLLFRSEQGTVLVSVLSADVVRVRFAPASGLGRDHSYAVVGHDFADPRARFSLGAAESTIETENLRVTMRHSPFRIAFASTAGESLDEDDAERGTAFVGKTTRVWKRLRADEHVYGFGEKTGWLDKRGKGLGGYSYAMWNSDTYAYDASIDPVYASVPFFMVLRQGRAHGIFLDNTHRTSFDVGKESAGLLSFGAEGGELNYYFLYGPTPKQVVARYTTLTGRMPLPPLWALGYHQCRYSYYPESRVRFIAENFRQRLIPADVIWLDIHYLDGYRPFTWDRERFPDPGRMIGDLRSQGFRVVTIVDPHPKKEAGYAPYDAGLLGNHFVRNPDGSVYEAPVWPSKAERDPGPSVFPDFSRPATREWWGGLYASLLDLGVAGIWNDMNEPAVFVDPAHTMPIGVRHDNDGEPTDHGEIHNVYGMLMSRATYEGLLRLRPNQRPFVLTRASFAGGQRYAALWPGDNVSDWSHLRASIPMLLGMGLSGLPFVGTDIGGFAEAPTPELFTRWLQLGVFHPFMRTHTALGTPDQEPWSYGRRHEDLNRRAIELRYELLPHLYNVMREASETGLPALRPLFLEYPADPATYSRDDEFLFGRDLLVAPVLREAVTEREVYLPAGEWHDFWTGQRYEGGRTIKRPVTLESIPIFVRGGAFVFRQPVVQHTGQMAGQTLRVFLYSSGRAEGRLYEDDGQTLDYRRGVFVRRAFEARRERSSGVIEVGAADGSYRPAPRDLQFLVRWPGRPGRVLLDGQPLAEAASQVTPLAGHGWSTTDDGFVVVTMKDRWDAFRLTIEPR